MHSPFNQGYKDYANYTPTGNHRQNPETLSEEEEELSDEKMEMRMKQVMADGGGALFVGSAQGVDWKDKSKCRECPRRGSEG